MHCTSSWRRISAGLAMLMRGLCFFDWVASSLSRTCLQRMTQLSQMYTPGPAMSFLTSACDLPQKLHSVILVGRAIELFFFISQAGGPLDEPRNLLARLHDLIHEAVSFRFFRRHKIIPIAVLFDLIDRT